MKPTPYITWALLALSLPFATQAQTYTITNLGSSSWSYSEAHGLNNLFQVVGEYEPTNFFYVKAFLYANGVITDLGSLQGTPYAVAYAINDSNQITGESNIRNDTHAFLYENGKMSDLGTLTPLGSGYSSGHAISRSGEVAGESSLADPNTIHAVLFSGGSITDLGAVGGDYSAAYGINNSGLVVGESDVVEQGVTNVHAFIYTNGSSSGMVDLGTLGGNYSSARGVNDSGTVVGEAEAVIGGNTVLHAFYSLGGEPLKDLGTLGGSTSSASAINNAGLIVGYATDTNEVANAFLYDGSTMINLIDLLPPNSGWTNLSSADGINDSGQIIGSGYLADGEFQGYLLTLNSPLTVAITNPIAGASFMAPATIALAATASDSSAPITNLQFLVNGSVVADLPSGPYSASVSNLAAGTFTLSAVAQDGAGLAATNTINITVTNALIGPIILLDPEIQSEGFSFSFTTQVGSSYAAQFTTPLSPTNNWMTFTNVTGTGSLMRVTDSTITSAERYYRVVAY